MIKNRVYSLAVLMSIVGCFNTVTLLVAHASDSDDEYKADKHIHIPFIHVDVHHNGDGSRDVSVKAPFAKVNKPAGVNNAQVRAPLTRVTHDGPTGNTTKAPFTKVVRHEDGTVSTKAPFADVGQH